MMNLSKWRKHFVERHEELFSGKVKFPEADCETRWFTAISAVSHMLLFSTVVQKATNLFRIAGAVSKKREMFFYNQRSWQTSLSSEVANLPGTS